MEQTKEVYETSTNLRSAENIVNYLWMKCEKEILPFHPLKAKDIIVNSEYEDMIYSASFIEKYPLDKSVVKTLHLSKDIEYGIDYVNYKNIDEKENIITEGKGILLYDSDNRFYAFFTCDEDFKNLHLVVVCRQKKDLLHSYPTERIEFSE